MNRFVFFIILVVLSVTSVMAQSVVGSKHDLSSGGGIVDKATNQDQVCIFCHTPHQKVLTIPPLWNHTLSSVANYGTYTSPTTDATITDIGGGTAVSNLCMSCHDGTVAVNSLDRGTATMGSGHELDVNGKMNTSGNGYLGASLANDHPINFEYNSALVLADPTLKTPFSAAYVDAGKTIPLYATQVQCASCHNAHDNVNSHFLRVSNSGSALCITCHSK